MSGFRLWLWYVIGANSCSQEHAEYFQPEDDRYRFVSVVLHAVSTLATRVVLSLLSLMEPGQTGVEASVATFGLIAALRACLHPLVCVWKNKKLRQACKQVLRWKGRNGVSSTSAAYVVEHEVGQDEHMEILEQIWNTGRQARVSLNRR